MRSSTAIVTASAACILLCACVSGCSDEFNKSGSNWTLNSLMKGLLGPSPKQKVAMAFDPNDADRRREGILGLSEKDWGLREPYLKGYAAILKTDEDPLVRSAAVRALGKAKDPNYVGDVARALFDQVDFVRQDAAVALDSLTGPIAVEPLRNRAVGDSDQDVRAGCAKALRHYRQEDVARTLIECLSDKAFGVRYQAHASLVSLTGTDRGYEPQDWAGLDLRSLMTAKPRAESGSWWDRLWHGSGKAPPEPATQPTTQRSD